MKMSKNINNEQFIIIY